MTRLIRNPGPALFPGVATSDPREKNNLGRMINQYFVQELPAKAMQRST